MIEHGRRVPNETPPVCYVQGDYGKYQRSWFARAPGEKTDAVLLRGVLAHGDTTISTELPGWTIVHGAWRPK